MQQEFIKYIQSNCDCSSYDNFLLAVSGGIDSVVMTHLFHQAKMKFAIAHCNFHLRDLESDEDQGFVKKLAGDMNVRLFVRHFHTKTIAENSGMSVQMTARKLRYEWFNQLVMDHHFDLVAVAHNRDDVIETFLINLSRGTGIRGLTGIKPRSDLVIRPLLFAGRKELTEFANKTGIAWREDSSNLDQIYQRNAIRHNILPAMEEINPGFRNNVINTIKNLDQTERLFHGFIEQLKENIIHMEDGKQLIDIGQLSQLPSQETVLFEILKPYGCNRNTTYSVVELLTSEPGKRIITETHTITKDRTSLIITDNLEMKNEEYCVDVNTYWISALVNLKFSYIHLTKQKIDIPTQKNQAMLDLDRIQFPLKIRRWRPGDKFRPLGMKGKKKISDFLIDQKVPLPDKAHIWLVESGGEIVWLINHRVDDRYKITDKTHSILHITSWKSLCENGY